MEPDNTLWMIGRIRENANRVITERLTAAGYGTLSPSHGDILFHLLRRGEMTKSELSSRIHRDKSTVTALLKKLGTAGLICTRKNPEDSRSELVCLSDAGRNLEPLLMSVSRELMNRLYGGIGEEEIKDFRKTLSLLLTNMED